MKVKNGTLFDKAKAENRADWLAYFKTSLSSYMQDKDPYDPQTVMDWREEMTDTDAVPLPAFISEEQAMEKTPRELAEEKLRKSLFDKGMDRNRIIEFLLKRLETDEELAGFINLEHKTMAKCWDYVKEEARKQAVNGCAFLEDETVFEFSLSYFRRDDKALEEQKAKEEAERKEKAAKKAAETKAKVTAKAEQKTEKAAEPERLLGKKDISGQMDLMSLFSEPEPARTDEPKEEALPVAEPVLTGLAPMPTGVSGKAELDFLPTREETPEGNTDSMSSSPTRTDTACDVPVAEEAISFV